MTLLENKNALITGATGGLGISISKQLAFSGCNLFLTSTNRNQLKNLKKELHIINSKIKINFFECDLSKKSNLISLVKNINKSFQKIDILINNAGILPIKLIEHSTFSDFEKCFNVNLRSPIFLTKEFSKNMKNQKWGRVVNIASSGAYNGQKKTIIYGSTKHALLGFSKATHKELRHFNVRVFCISPGPIKSNMGKTIIPKLNPDENFSTFINPNDIANFIKELISYDSEMFSEEIRLGRIIGEK